MNMSLFGKLGFFLVRSLIFFMKSCSKNEARARKENEIKSINKKRIVEEDLQSKNLEEK